jgi:cytochrome c biogenesis protein
MTGARSHMEASTEDVEGAEPVHVTEDETSPGRSAVGWGWGRWTWRTLTSMRTALILLALLALAAVPGSVLPQRGVSSDPAAVIRFTRDHPTLAVWLDRFYLFEVYSSPWFAAIYLLLLISMTGCVVPRCARLWRSSRAAPPAAPQNLARMPGHQSWDTEQAVPAVLSSAAEELRRRGFRVRLDTDEVRAERGYLREVGNLVFHLSLLVLLLGVAIGQLFGFEGRVALAEKSAFSNVISQYDEFNPKALTDVNDLEPLSFTLDDFRVSFETAAPRRGEPRQFAAELSYTKNPGSPTEKVAVRPNHPLDVNGTKVFLTGHGYAPRVIVRDGGGDVVFTGPVIFLPNDASYASDGVVKVPDARPEQLGFEGFFLPTAAVGPQGPYSAFPDALNPQLFLTVYTGDLGLSGGVPQSVYTLDKTDLEQVRVGDDPFASALRVGETMTLPDGQGRLTFDGVSRFANFQIAYDPGKEISLIAAVMLMVGLTASLMIRRRRIWVRARLNGQSGAATSVEVAGLAVTRRGAPSEELNGIAAALRDRPEARRTDPVVSRPHQE